MNYCSQKCFLPTCFIYIYLGVIFPVLSHCTKRGRSKLNTRCLKVYAEESDLLLSSSSSTREETSIKPDPGLHPSLVSKSLNNFIILLYYCNYFTLYKFFTPVVIGSSLWSPRDSKSPQLSRTLLSIFVYNSCFSVCPWIVFLFCFCFLLLLTTVINLLLLLFVYFAVSTVLQFLLLYLSISIFTHPSARTGYNTRSILKRSLTGLNSEFSFS